MDMLITAVTRLGQGICVAGVKVMDKTVDRWQWVRPTRMSDENWLSLSHADLYDDAGNLTTKVGNIVRWEMGEKLPPDGPLVENVHHPANGSRTLVRSLAHDEYLDICDQLSHDAVAISNYLSRRSSLALLRPDRICEVTIASSRYRRSRLQPRITFEYDGRSLDYAVTDMTWYDFCMEECDPDIYRYREFEMDYGLSIEYLVVGRGQWYKGDYWPFIIGVVCSESVAEIMEAG